MSNRPRLRLLTLNIAHARGLSTYQGFHSVGGIKRNLDRIANLLRTCEADIVALQEVDSDSHWNKHIDLLDLFKREAGYDFSYLGINNQRRGRKPLNYGNGILSRYAIAHAENQPFGNASLGEKGFIYVEINLPHGLLPVVNLHLDFRSRNRRIIQIEELVEFLEARHLKNESKGFLSPIVCGDFNSRATAQRDAVQHLIQYLKEHCAYTLLPNRGATFPSLLPTHGLDFIFVPPSYEVIRCEILRAYVSDHRPVIAEFEFLESNTY